MHPPAKGPPCPGQGGSTRRKRSFTSTRTTFVPGMGSHAQPRQRRSACRAQTRPQSARAVGAELRSAVIKMQERTAQERLWRDCHALTGSEFQSQPEHTLLSAILILSRRKGEKRFGCREGRCSSLLLDHRRSERGGAGGRGRAEGILCPSTGTPATHSTEQLRAVLPRDRKNPSDARAVKPRR